MKPLFALAMALVALAASDAFAQGRHAPPAAAGTVPALAASAAAAATRTTHPEEEPSLPNRPVVPTVIADPMNRVGGPVYLTVTFKNVSRTPQTIENAIVKIEGTADSRFDGGKACDLAVSGMVPLTPGDSFTQTCRLPAQAGPVPAEGDASDAAASARTGWESQSWYQAVLSVDLRPFVEVTVTDAGSARFYPQPFTVKAQESSIFIGGVVGAMLLAIFVAAERILKNPAEREDWPRTIWVTLVMGLRGGLLAVVALLLGKTTQGVGSPVSLSVTDFSGGVLIGLFSYPLASWISSTLKLDGVFVASEDPQKDKGKNKDGASAGGQAPGQESKTR